MNRTFNTDGYCDPEINYMVDLSDRLARIKAMVDSEKYFTINRARQYGKTTILTALADYLKEHHDYAYATVVHCDTPSGVLNDIGSICPLLKQYGILTVVDSVSGMFGEEVRVDDFKIDLLCGGSQKAVSAPPGLTFVVVSDDAKKKIKTRKTPIASFYANLAVFEGYYEKKWFPYTMPISDIYGLRAAFDNIAADKDLYARHKRIGAAARAALCEAGLRLHLDSGFSDTVTVLDVPRGVTADAILKRMKDRHGILLAGSFDELAGKVIRIGHMGTNATFENMLATMEALSETLTHFGVPLAGNLADLFLKHYRFVIEQL